MIGGGLANASAWFAQRMARVLFPEIMNTETFSAVLAARFARAVVLIVTLSGPAMLRAQNAPAQTDSSHGDRTFFTRRDAVLTGLALVGSVAVSHFDVKISRWVQTPGVQGGSSRRSLVDNLTHINETPLTIGAIVTYGVGRLGRWNTVTDIGLHMTESLVLTDVFSQVVRGPVGRVRPLESPDDAFKFQFGKGFTSFSNRSFPSLHSASAFATAASLTAEIHERSPRAAWTAGPLLYVAALVPGGTRLYLNQHWASDVVSGAFVGTLFGVKVVDYAHSHRRSKLDRFLMGSTISPDGHGGVLVSTSFTR
jgi:membrane-associated phospholipid phosphatase